MNTRNNRRWTRESGGQLERGKMFKLAGRQEWEALTKGKWRCRLQNVFKQLFYTCTPTLLHETGLQLLKRCLKVKNIRVRFVL